MADNHDAYNHVAHDASDERAHVQYGNLYAEEDVGVIWG